MPLRKCPAPNISPKTAVLPVDLSSPNYLWAFLGYIKDKKLQATTPPAGEEPHGPLNSTLGFIPGVTIAMRVYGVPAREVFQAELRKPGTGIHG